MDRSDRLKNYISDYLENSLDPTMHKEFEDALRKSADLRAITGKMTTLSTHLSNLKSHKCSEDFTIKLRDRIHTSSEPFISRQNIVRYSFAASFVIILIAAIFTLTNLSSESPEISPDFQGTSEGPMNNTSPVSTPLSGNEANTFIDDGELDVGTKSNPNAINDSTDVQQEKNKNNPPIKYVDQKE
jgi:hypothetical protein